MTERINVAELPLFDAARYLSDEQAIAAYLSDILAAGDPALLAAALGDIARARGMSEIARAAGLTREALYKALRAGAQPRLDTVQRVCTALGVRLVVQPVEAADPAPTKPRPVHATKVRSPRRRALAAAISPAMASSRPAERR